MGKMKRTLAGRLQKDTRLTGTQGRYVYIVRGIQDDNVSHNVCGFSSKPRAEKFRKICQADADLMYADYDKRVRAGLGLTRTRIHGNVDPKYLLNYPNKIRYVLEDIPVLTATFSFPTVTTAILYDKQKAEKQEAERKARLENKT